MKIFIQDYKEKLFFSKGLVCNKLIGVGEHFSTGMIFFFTLLDKTWYRFCISEGILYWSEGEPDEENDLDLGEKYFDILSELLIDSDELKLKKIEIKNHVLTISINDFQLIFKSTDDSTCETIVKLSYIRLI